MRNLILIWSISLSFLMSAQECAFNNSSFQVGEDLEYRIGYSLWGMWVKAGVVNFTVKDSTVNEESFFHLYAYGKTLEKYDWMFKVRDTYESLLDKESYKPNYFHRDVLEGDTEFENYVNFDFDSLNAKTKNGTFGISPCTYDVVSAIYYCRSIDWTDYKLRDTIPLNLFLDDSAHQVYVRYLGKEIINTNQGKFNAVKFSPLLIAGTIFESGEDMMVWVTDDENKMPLRVSSPILIGEVKAEIVGWKNLKNELRSKLEEK